MADEKEVEEDITSPTEDTVVEEAPREAYEIVQEDKDADRKSIKELLRSNFDKAKREPSAARQEAAKQRAREEGTGKFVPKKENAIESTASAETPADSAAPSARADTPTTETPTPVAPPATPSVAVAPPGSWSKEAKDAWASLPPAVQQAAAKREQEVSNGFQQYQTRYQDIDRAFTPQREAQLQQLGKTRGQAVDQLFAWHEALGDPRRQADAFRALAQSHGIDLSTLVPGFSPQGQQNFDPNDPRQFLQQAVQPLYERINALDANYQRMTAEQQQVVNQRTHAELAEFAKDKPHFEAVRSKMAELFEGARVTGRQITLQEAYDAAVWGSGDLRQTLLAEQDAKRKADAEAAQKAEEAKAAAAEAERRKKDKEAAEKARRANVSPRASTPVGSAAPRKSGSDSVREDILKAYKEASRTSV